MVEFDPQRHIHLVKKYTERKEEDCDWEADNMRKAIKQYLQGLGEDEAAEHVSVQGGTVVSHAEQVMEDVRRYEDEQNKAGEGDAADSTFSDPGERKAEYLREWFEEMQEHTSLKENYIDRVVFEVKNKDRFMDPDALGNSLDNGKSGTDNYDEIRWIIQQYQEFLERYKAQFGWRDQGGYISNPDNIPGARADPSSMAKVQGSPPQHTGPSGGGPWTQGGQQGQGAHTRVGQQPQQGQPAQGQGQMNPMMAQMMETLRGVQETQAEIVDAINNGGGGGGEQESELDQLLKLERKKQEFLEEMGEDSQGNQEWAAIRQEIRDLKSSQESQPAMQAAGDTKEGALLQFAQREDTSPEQVKAFAESIGYTSDPEVEKKRLDKEMKEQEYQEKRQSQQEMLEQASEVTETVTDKVLDRVFTGDDDGGTDQGGGGGTQQGGGGPPQQQPPQQQAPQPGGQGAAAMGGAGTPGAMGPGAAAAGQAPQQTPQQSVEWECRECGATTEQDPHFDGRECKECGFTIAGCEACGEPVHVPPNGEPESFSCPACSNGVVPAEDMDDEEVQCSDCDWTGDPDDLGPEAVKCGDCGHRNIVHRAATPNTQ